MTDGISFVPAIDRDDELIRVLRADQAGTNTSSTSMDIACYIPVVPETFTKSRIRNLTSSTE